MISNCPNCGLLKSTGVTGYALPQCLCQWKDPTTAQEWFSEIMGAALFDFQEATGCDSAEEYVRRKGQEHEALRLALEALEEIEKVMKQYNFDNGYVAIRRGFVLNAIRAIKELESQAPVAWRLNGESSLGHGKVFGDWKSGNPPADVADLASVDKNWSLEFAYTTPPAQRTEQEPVAMYREKCADGKRCLHGCHTNEPCYTHPPQRTEQEPVAIDWERIAKVQNAKLMAMCDEAGGFEKLCEVMNKYKATHPPQRKPLTDEQLLDLLDKIDNRTVRLPVGFRAFARAIEAAHGIKE